MSFTRVSLDDVKRIKNDVGCTVNDVVLGLMGGTLRRYLEAHDALPDTPLIAVCPVSVRTEDQRGELNNKVSAMFTSLATDVDDPIERLAGHPRGHQGRQGRPQRDRRQPAPGLGRARRAHHVRPGGARLYSSMNLSDRHRPIHNVVISNVPGPPFPLYYAGAKARVHAADGSRDGGRRPQHHRALLHGQRRHRLHGVPRARPRRVEARRLHVQEAMAELLKAVDEA